MRLYGYYRSTSSYRLRIALALKGLDYQSLAINLKDGEQLQAPYRAINPQCRVPTLELDSGARLYQSPALLEYLEECYPTPPLLSTEPLQRARARAVAALISCDIHPLHNVSVLNQLRQLGHDEEQLQHWNKHWISLGLDSIEQWIGDSGWCFGPQPGLADVYLIPQLYAAARFSVDLAPYPRLRRVAALAEQHPAFQQAHPANQPDCPPS
ncbi:maleylacetoacetate isomerase [Pseudomonas sp. 5P_3.1_Bac2]|uniref:maleylacetoacetate isomerase n=1 Tax=Pseudomonas sp. 5P_3.1_Bac2 TaxID=2971617 RepID=UPI0021C660E5|nr:maleylacetoacetate isomerase [Pseudomonas sp. 5P_3.1_Bac2]MCU1717185.1 maleylacetoacetate isomerase [Pseudomonas sp. 5P_3.1_Bac2]